MQIADQEISIVVAQCCAIKTNVIVASQLHDVSDARTVHNSGPVFLNLFLP